MQRWPQPLALLVVVFAIYEVAYLGVYLWHSLHGSERPFGDFFAFWSFARFTHALPAEQIYDVAALQHFQQALPGGLHGFYPCAYPPIFLLCLWPLGWLAYLPAYGAWIATTLGAYLVAVAGRDWRSPRLWLAIVAPTTLFAIVAGQNGFLTAALMIGGFRLIGRWPFLGGILLGGLAFKPQLFVLVPMVLLATRRWRSLAGLAASVLGLGAASAAAFGPAIWLRWLQALPMLWQLFEDNRPELSHLMPSVAASLLGAGVGRGATQALQAVVTLGVVGCLWLLFHRDARRHAAPRAMDVAALQVGVFLVTPYAFIYDMPMVTSAVATTIESCTRAGRPWQLGETTVLVATLLLPILMLSGAMGGWPVGPLTLLPLLAVTVRAGWAMPA
jgi:hypothetical protein